MSDAYKPPSSGWREWSKYVLTALEKADERMTAFENRLRKMETEQAVLKAKLAFYVAAATGIAVLIIEVVVHVFKK